MDDDLDLRALFGRFDQLFGRFDQLFDKFEKEHEGFLDRRHYLFAPEEYPRLLLNRVNAKDHPPYDEGDYQRDYWGENIDLDEGEGPDPTDRVPHRLVERAAISDKFRPPLDRGVWHGQPMMVPSRVMGTVADPPQLVLRRRGRRG